jgi:hypothetical protein
VLDLLVAAAVEALPLTTPPTSPAIGDCYIVGANPTGEWAGHAQNLAGYTAGGWRFLTPRDGMSAYVRTNGSTALYHDGSWEIGTLKGSQLMVGGLKVVSARGAAIADPAPGATVDAEARTTIGEILAALRQHGLIEM